MSAAIEATEYAVHPVADYFPMMDGPDYEAFKRDINNRGLVKPIEVDREGRLIDGRNRLRACRELGIEPDVAVVDVADPTSYIISCNLHRRQLNDVQRARIGEKIATRAKGQYERTEQIGHMADLPDETPEVVPSQEEVAKLLHVSDRQIRRARVVTEKGVPELNALVDNGGLPLATAERIARQPVEKQQAAVREIASGSKPTKVAPPPPVEAIKPPVKYGPRRKHLQMLDATNASLGGLLIALAEITELDDSVGNDDAARIRGGISKAIAELNRINNLLKERTK